MTRPDKILTAVLALREGEEQACRQQALAEEQSWRAAELATEQAAAIRDEAVVSWEATIGQRNDGVAVRSIAANWLVGRQAELAAALVGADIARRRRDDAHEIATMARARVMVTGELRREAASRQEALQAERRLAAVEDLFVARWRR